MPDTALDLNALLDVVDGACADDEFDGPHLLFALERDPHADVATSEPDADASDDVVLAFRSIDGHPSDTLLGFVAPPACVALGVVSFGWSAPMDGVRPSRHPDRERMRCAAVMTRAGDEAARITFAGGRVVGADELGRPSVGLIPDCLRRAFDIPTAPPAVPAAALFALWWLLDVASNAGGRRRLLGWSAAARLHPLGDERATDQELIDRGSDATWSDLRERAVFDGWFRSDIDPVIASWMDEGMFSRWLLEAMPPAATLMRDCRRVLTPAAVRRVERVVAAAGLDAR